MADFLYVCHFSNGHIKVGRSIDPQSRIASHADRVACLGVELIEQHVVECVGPSEPREAMLIGRCIAAAAVRNKNEWFEGLDFAKVLAWANECAGANVPTRKAPSGHLSEYLGSAGAMSVSQLREAMCALGAQVNSDAQIRQWIACGADGEYKRQPGAGYAMYLERATGGRVTRQAMRSDYYEIWPDLARRNEDRDNGCKERT